LEGKELSVNITTHYTQHFSRNVALLLQQSDSRFRGKVTEASYEGKQASPVNQFGSITAQKVTTRFGDMPRIDATTARRWVLPVDYDLPQLLDSFDLLKTLEDPRSSYVENAANAMKRAMDDEIIGAFFAAATTGETAAATTAHAAAQQIAVDFGASSDVGMTVAKLREARKILLEAEVDLENDPLYCALAAKQLDNLLAEAQVISTDFNDRPVLVDGMLSRFLGVNFVLSERLDTVSGDRANPMWVKSGMHLGIWNDIRTSISQRNDMQGEPWQVYLYGSFGATRLEEEKVIRILSNE